MHVRLAICALVGFCSTAFAGSSEYQHLRLTREAQEGLLKEGVALMDAAERLGFLPNVLRERAATKDLYRMVTSDRGRAVIKLVQQCAQENKIDCLRAHIERVCAKCSDEDLCIAGTACLLMLTDITSHAVRTRSHALSSDSIALYDMVLFYALITELPLTDIFKGLDLIIKACKEGLAALERKKIPFSWWMIPVGACTVIVSYVRWKVLHGLQSRAFTNFEGMVG